MTFKVFYEQTQSPKEWGVGDVLQHKGFGYTVRVVKRESRGLVIEYSAHKRLLEWDTLDNFEKI